MKCPRCETENENRSVCKSCGMFLYDGRTRNRARRTPAQIRADDARKVARFSGKILKYVWILIVMIVMSFLMIAAIQFFAN